jgi:hypothetical protein
MYIFVCEKNVKGKEYVRMSTLVCAEEKKGMIKQNRKEKEKYVFICVCRR